MNTLRTCRASPALRTCCALSVIRRGASQFRQVKRHALAQFPHQARLQCAVVADRSAPSSPMEAERDELTMDFHVERLHLGKTLDVSGGSLLVRRERRQDPQRLGGEVAQALALGDRPVVKALVAEEVPGVELEGPLQVLNGAAALVCCEGDQAGPRLVLE